MYANIARGQRAITSLSLALSPYSTFLRRKLGIIDKHNSEH